MLPIPRGPYILNGVASVSPNPVASSARGPARGKSGGARAGLRGCRQPNLTSRGFAAHRRSPGGNVCCGFHAPGVLFGVQKGSVEFQCSGVACCVFFIVWGLFFAMWHVCVRFSVPPRVFTRGRWIWHVTRLIYAPLPCICNFRWFTVDENGFWELLPSLGGSPWFLIVCKTFELVDQWAGISQRGRGASQGRRG